MSKKEEMEFDAFAEDYNRALQDGLRSSGETPNYFAEYKVRYLAQRLALEPKTRILDFGCGTLGDMGIHIFDTPFKSLDLTDPLWVEAECRTPNGFGHAETNKVHYGFAPTKYTTDNFTFTWWDGAGAPRHNGNPDLQLPNGDKLPKQGALYVGEAGRMVLPHCSMPTFYPDSVLDGVDKKGFQNVNHYTQFLNAIQGKDKTLAGFDYAGPLTDVVLLGAVALRTGKKIRWDGPNRKATNAPEADKYIKPAFRKGWGL